MSKLLTDGKYVLIDMAVVTLAMSSDLLLDCLFVVPELQGQNVCGCQIECVRAPLCTSM